MTLQDEGTALMWQVLEDVPDRTDASCLFDSPGWLRVWPRLGVERCSRQALVATGAPDGPAVLPVSEVALSPFWHGYEAQTELLGRFGGPIVFAGSTYSMYTRRGPVPAALARGAYRTAMDWIADGPAETLVVPNLTEEGVRDWVAAVGAPVGTVLLERTYSYDISDEVTGDFAGHLARVTTGKIRRDVERRLRRGEERGLSVTMLQGDEAKALVPAAFPLTVDTSDKNDWPALFDEASLAGLLDVPGAMLAAARVEGRLVGVFFGFRRGREVTFLCGGVDYPSLHDLSTYVALMYRCTQWAYEHGMRRIEWGRDNYRFKERHGLTGTNLWALVYAPRPVPGLSDAVEHMNDVLTRYIEGI